MEPLVIIVLSYIGGVISQMLFNVCKKDDGIFSIKEDKCEVIFRDPYEKLVKKKSVLLKNKS